jgi:hypothetical protein
MLRASVFFHLPQRRNTMGTGDPRSPYVRRMTRTIGVRALAAVVLLFPSCVLPLHHLGDKHHATHLLFHFPSDAPHVPASLQESDTPTHAAEGPCPLCLLMAFAPLAELDGSPDSCTPLAIAVACIWSGEVLPQSHPTGSTSPRAPPRFEQDIASHA